jgi:hypothetical protein
MDVDGNHHPKRRCRQPQDANKGNPAPFFCL